MAHSYYRRNCMLSFERWSSPCKLQAMQCPWSLRHINAYSFLCTSLTKKGISFDSSQLLAYFWRVKLSQMNFCCPVILSVNGFFLVMLYRWDLFLKQWAPSPSQILVILLSLQLQKLLRYFQVSKCHRMDSILPVKIVKILPKFSLPGPPPSSISLQSFHSDCFDM